MSNTPKRKRYASEWPETGAKKKKTEGSFSPAPDTAPMSQQEWHWEGIRLHTATIVKKRQRDWWEDVRVTKRARSAAPETMVPDELQEKEPEEENRMMLLSGELLVSAEALVHSRLGPYWRFLVH
jgi:hypothetical protein